MSNTIPSSQPTSRVRRAVPALLLASGLGLILTLVSGCNVDSFLDPSVTGRWEATPTIVPILERISVIEPEDSAYVEVTDIQPHDLIPEIAEYRIGPGDMLEVVLYDLIHEGVPEYSNVQVTALGTIDITALGKIYVNGLNDQEVELVLAQAMADIVADPLVQVNVLNPRSLIYNVIGGQTGGGTFLIPQPNFRLLEALTTAGGVNESLAEVFIIRQEALTGAAAGTTSTGRATPPTVPDVQDATGEDLLDIIDDLSGDGSPGAFAVMGSSQSGQEEPPEPVVDLIGEDTPAVDNSTQSTQPPSPGTNWVFLNGKWVQVDPGAQQNSGQIAGDGALAREQLVTQRVIGIPLGPLLAGDARYNPVIRPGDIIRIPSGFVGNVYIGGQIARPGVYTVVPQLTLTRLIDSAGGLGGLAIPERVDLTRMVGTDRQATITLNFRAISEGTQPDLFIKSNDRINIGTNFWALPLAVIRGGFRFSYGFGFLLDRNFGNDVFGPPPTNIGNGR